jgi:hypothetical protein
MRSKRIVAVLATLAFLPAVGFAQDFGGGDDPEFFPPPPRPPSFNPGQFPPDEGGCNDPGAGEPEDDFDVNEVTFADLEDKFSCDDVVATAGQKKLLGIIDKILKSTRTYKRSLIRSKVSRDTVDEMTLPDDKLKGLAEEYIEACLSDEGGDDDGSEDDGSGDE